VLAIGLALAVAGWVAGTRTPVQSDITKLVPSGTAALRDLERLERVSGVSGEVDVTVHAPNVATPAVVAWMHDYEQQVLAHYGYHATGGCAAATLCPALSLPDLLGAAGGVPRTRTQIRALLQAIPGYFSRSVVTGDRTGALIAFGIRLMPLGEQERVIDYLRSALHPPPGVSAQLAGLPVLAADANAALASSSRRLEILVAGLAAVALLLLVVLRQWRRVLAPLVPIALASGWSGLILYLLGTALNPMSVTLGALVIALCTEFSVLLSERYRQERRPGTTFEHALERAYRSTGAAVLASATTATAGFAVLLLSPITMLRDFGAVTVVDLSVSLAGVILVLPAVLALTERRA
jgi:predicted RND superfamily exporter protein